MAVIEAIATTYLEADAASVTFSSIPATYEHLQIRGTHRADTSPTGTGGLAFFIQLGGASDSPVDTGANYSSHHLVGASSSASDGARTGDSYIYIYDMIHGSGVNAAEYATLIMDILDYANTNKNTTVAIHAANALTHGDTRVMFVSGLWDDTEAVTDIKLFSSGSKNLVRGSEYTLYGLNSS